MIAGGGGTACSWSAGLGFTVRFGSAAMGSPLRYWAFGCAPTAGELSPSSAQLTTSEVPSSVARHTPAVGLCEVCRRRVAGTGEREPPCAVGGFPLPESLVRPHYRLYPGMTLFAEDSPPVDGPGVSAKRSTPAKKAGRHADC